MIQAKTIHINTPVDVDALRFAAHQIIDQPDSIVASPGNFDGQNSVDAQFSKPVQDFFCNMHSIRVRATDYRDFTIRAKSKHGKQTELDKLQCVRACYSAFYTYVWKDKHNQPEACFVIDIRKARDAGIWADAKNFNRIRNNDATEFVAVSLSRFRDVEGCVLVDWTTTGELVGFEGVF